MDSSEIRYSLGKHLVDVDCVKDVKFVHFWPVLAEAFPDAVWLIVWRDPDKIAASCVRTKFMKKLGTHEEWKVWAETYHQRCRELLAQYPDRVFEVDSSCLRTHNEGISGAVKAVGLEWDETAIDRVFDPSRWSG